MFRNRHGNAGDVDFLKGIPSEKMNADVSRNRDKRNGIHKRRCKTRDQVGGARSAGCDHDARASRGAGIPVRRMHRALFVRRDHVVDRPVAVECVVNIEHRSAGISEYRVYALFF